MLGPGFLPKLLITAGYALAGLAGGLLLWALFSDRARGRRRCPRCWYDLSPSLRSSPNTSSGFPVGGVTCPECGRTARTERALTRTRRRWRWAVAALVLLAGSYVLHATPRLSRSGWIGLAPTTGLIWWVGRYEPPERYENGAMSPPTRWAAELAARSGREELWVWQWRWMLRELEAVRAHERWPRDEPVYRVSTGVPYWLQAAGPGYAFESSLPNAGRPMPDHLFAWNAGQLDPLAPHLTITITRGIYRAEWPLRVQLVDSAEECLEPVSGPGIDEEVRRVFAPSIRADYNPWETTDSALSVGVRREHAPALDGVVLGVMVEFLHNGAVTTSHPLCVEDCVFTGSVDWVRLHAPFPAWTDDRPNRYDGWTVRVRGDARTSLRDTKRRRYWAGEYTGPLRDFVR